MGRRGVSRQGETDEERGEVGEGGTFVIAALDLEDVAAVPGETDKRGA